MSYKKSAGGSVPHKNFSSKFGKIRIKNHWHTKKIARFYTFAWEFNERWYQRHAGTLVTTCREN